MNYTITTLIMFFHIKKLLFEYRMLNPVYFRWETKMIMVSSQIANFSDSNILYDTS